ncbi:MAG: hypothetical protein GPJ54_19660 [Candidatus Heimdallarchaeota archaeon]|nr:hypothetical protein [Candidatus Heimdallarchaeota archaeon]
MVDLVYYTKIDGDMSKSPLFMVHTVPQDSTYLLESLDLDMDKLEEEQAQTS